jgi:hypothetical protein
MNNYQNLFLVEGDPLIAKRMQRAARAAGVCLDVFHPEHDFFQLPPDGDYELAIIDADDTIISTYERTRVILLDHGRFGSDADAPAKLIALARQSLGG